MARRPLLRFPDPRLRTRCAPVERFDAALAELAADLVETMRAAPGIGITAGHVGIPLRLVAIELGGPDTARFYVNPVILSASAATGRHAEGSVSMPGVTEDVVRPLAIRLAYRTLAGEPREEEADGLLAVCLQHEIDQLDGIFWIDRLSRLKRERVVKRFRKISG
ncbi:peptide deformylase [Rhizobium sp. TRM95111]|uniref:peptide deformylase n=1 Tax=Rhizobium alarense TaxID=2846851 RepID=UPI001F3470E1|nr:peptide deformylase [Rhizobium alarense]MCF3639765.1 peptide deformylase [Rhizobium alarense]